MIRDAIARHAGAGPGLANDALRASEPEGCMSHASHGLLAVVASSDGSCVIEPSVRCNHCGYCKSLGH